MPFTDLYARCSPLRVLLTVGLLLLSWLVQSCTPGEGPRPSPMPTTATALTPAEAAVPSAPDPRPVVMAFTGPAACAVFEHVGSACRRIAQEGTPVGVEVETVDLMASTSPARPP